MKFVEASITKIEVMDESVFVDQPERVWTYIELHNIMKKLNTK